MAPSAQAAAVAAEAAAKARAKSADNASPTASPVDPKPVDDAKDSRSPPVRSPPPLPPTSANWAADESPPPPPPAAAEDSAESAANTSEVEAATLIQSHVRRRSAKDRVFGLASKSKRASVAAASSVRSLVSSKPVVPPLPISRPVPPPPGGRATPPPAPQWPGGRAVGRSSPLAMPKPSGNVLSRASEKAKSAVNRTARGVASTVTGGGEFARKLFKDPKGAASDLGGLLASGTGGMGQALQLMSALTSGPNGGLDAVLVLGRAVRDSNDTKKRVAYVKMLRRSLDVLMRLAKAATHRPAVVDFLVQQVDSKLSEMHLNGGVQLEESGPLSNYRLELLRHNRSESQALRAIAVTPARKRSKAMVYHYELVRRTNLSEPPMFQETLNPADVLKMGFVRDLTVKFEPAKIASITPLGSAATPSPPVSGESSVSRPSSPAIGTADDASPAGSSGSVGSAVAGGLGKMLPGKSRFGIGRKGGAAAAAAAATAAATEAAAKAAAAAANAAATTAEATVEAIDPYGPATDSEAEAEAESEAGTSAAESPATVPDVASPVAQVDALLRSKCCGDAFVRCLPTWWKAQLPFEVPEEWMPEYLRDHADEVVSLRHNLELRLVFDPESGGAALDVMGVVGEEAAGKFTSPDKASGGDKTPRTPRTPGTPRAQPQRETVRFQLQLTGRGCWPTLGQLTVRSVRFHAQCKLWWEVFGEKVHLAFLRGNEAHEQATFDWDVDLSLMGCGMPLPEALEDRMISALVTFITRSHNQLNPLVIDLSELVQDSDQSGAATTIQASWRSKKARRQTNVHRAVTSGPKLETQVTAMESEIRELKQMVGALQAELASQKGPGSGGRGSPGRW